MVVEGAVVLYLFLPNFVNQTLIQVIFSKGEGIMDQQYLRDLGFPKGLRNQLAKKVGNRYYPIVPCSLH